MVVLLEHLLEGTPGLHAPAHEPRLLQELLLQEVHHRVLALQVDAAVGARLRGRGRGQGLHRRRGPGDEAAVVHGELGDGHALLVVEVVAGHELLGDGAQLRPREREADAQRRLDELGDAHDAEAAEVVVLVLRQDGLPRHIVAEAGEDLLDDAEAARLEAGAVAVRELHRRRVALVASLDEGREGLVLDAARAALADAPVQHVELLVVEGHPQLGERPFELGRLQPPALPFVERRHGLGDVLDAREARALALQLHANVALHGGEALRVAVLHREVQERRPVDTPRGAADGPAADGREEARDLLHVDLAAVDRVLAELLQRQLELVRRHHARAARVVRVERLLAARVQGHAFDGPHPGRHLGLAVRQEHHELAVVDLLALLVAARAGRLLPHRQIRGAHAEELEQLAAQLGGVQVAGEVLVHDVEELLGDHPVAEAAAAVAAELLEVRAQVGARALALHAA